MNARSPFSTKQQPAPFTEKIVFFFQAQKFDIYVNYCTNKPGSTKLLVDHGGTYFEALQRKYKLEHPIAAYLIKPVQRITKYQLLLKDLLSCCSKDRPGEIKEGLEVCLNVPKKANDALLAENKKSQNDLEKERQQHQVIMASIRKELGKYTAQIRAKQREADKIDSAIDRIIKTAIAKSKTNKKITTKTASGSFALTPEEKVLSNNFASNKGKLPWPVENGYVSLGYGTQPHPINKSLTIKSNGVRINTKNGAKARAVFDGKVMSIVRLKNVNPIVMVQHGNYITTYKNLSKLYVKEGDTVKTKQVLGDVATNNFTGKTTLSFIVSKGSATQNPKSWIYKM